MAKAQIAHSLLTTHMFSLINHKHLLWYIHSKLVNGTNVIQ